MQALADRHTPSAQAGRHCTHPPGGARVSGVQAGQARGGGSQQRGAVAQQPVFELRQLGEVAGQRAGARLKAQRLRGWSGGAAAAEG